MNKKLASVILSSVGLLLVIAWMADLFEDRIEPGVIESSPASAEQGIPAQLQPVAVTESVPGTIVAREATDISSRMMARIESIAVRSGDAVRKGDLLVQLEKADLEARSAQARDQVASIRARLDESRLQLERIETLLAKGQIARAEYDRAAAAVASMQADLSAAEQALHENETALAFSTIRAPIDGRIIDRFAEPGDTATPGQKLLSLYNPLSLRVEAHAREGLALALTDGESVFVDIPSLNRQSTGTVEEIVPAANPGARSFQLHVALDYSPDVLPGMFARLNFTVGAEDRLLIPVAMISQVGQLDMIGIVENGQIQRRVIRTGEVRGDDVEVLSGLEPGERLVELPR